MAAIEYGLVLRGHVLREGGQGKFNADGNEEDLRLVLHSVCMNACSLSNGLVFVAVDVVWLGCSLQQAERLRDLLRFYLEFPNKGLHVRVHNHNLGVTQTSSLLETLSWVRPYANTLSKSACLLFLRCDCVLQSYFQIDAWIAFHQRNFEEKSVMVFPFVVDVGGPADQIFLLPLECWDNFERAVQKLSQHKPASLHARSLHFLHRPECLGSHIAYFIDVEADANTYKEWNPFFVTMGRVNKARDTSSEKWNMILDASTRQHHDDANASESPKPLRTCDHCLKYTRSEQCQQCRGWVCAACKYSCDKEFDGCGMHVCESCNVRNGFISEFIPGLWKCRACAVSTCSAVTLSSGRSPTF